MAWAKARACKKNDITVFEHTDIKFTELQCMRLWPVLGEMH